MNTGASAARKRRTKVVTLRFVGRSARIRSTRTAEALPSSFASWIAWWETLSSAASTAASVAEKMRQSSAARKNQSTAQTSVGVGMSVRPS